MKKIIILIKILFVYFFITLNAYAKDSDSFFKEGKELYEKKKYEKSKIFFQKDIVFNPKSERSYLYLAKIFNQNKDDQKEEMKLNNVLLLNPSNDEAIYMLIMLKIKQSDYDKASKLIERFNLVCNSFCSKKTEIKEKYDKLIPVNANN
jgi:tetratricopeptide (TPR) repeat protein